MFGKERSRFGEFIDRHGIKQEKIREISKVSPETISRVCKDRDYMPAGKTMKALVDAVRKLTENKSN
ncbi:hypothetical protein ASG81_20670 [Paenibacillus sp. Soil522]|nr:hypothetical protein ASG81_20670 [Paenibacillus sp. Soil522]